MISVPRGTEMFQFPRCPPYRYGLAIRSWVMKPTGLPHSEIPGYASTRLTEAYRSVATSFIGPRRPGIHPAPLLVCVQRRPGLRSAARRMSGGERNANRKLGDAHAHGERFLPGEARDRHNHVRQNADTEP